MEWVALGTAAIFVGFILIFAGMLCIFYHAWEQAKEASQRSQIGDSGQNTEQHEKPSVRGGGIVMIGPFPIIFGTDVASVKVLIILAAVLMLFAFIILILMNRMMM